MQEILELLNNLLTNFSAFFGLISLILSAGVTIFVIRKTKAEASKLESETWNVDADTAKLFQEQLHEEIKSGEEMRSTIRTLRDRMAELEDRIDQLELDLESRDTGIAILINQLTAKGEVPLWKLPKSKDN